MPLIDIVIVPYRTMNFARKFGFTVRDLMILQVLQEHPSVASITWLERPTLPIERILSPQKKLKFPKKTEVKERISWNIFQALTLKRLWPRTAMKIHNGFIRDWNKINPENIKVVLDFHPLFEFDDDLLDNNIIYWYDLIDNFAIHNVYSEFERAVVRSKYTSIKRNAHIVTGVSDAALRDFPEGITLPNRLIRKNVDDLIECDPLKSPEYDFGFTGFITDKFDINFIRSLSDLGYRIIIRGKAYHASIASELGKIKNVTVGGAYHANEQKEIIRSFKVGLIPYIPEKSHDESPIKLTQYLEMGRPVLTSKKFGEVDVEFSRWVVNYNAKSGRALRHVAEDLLDQVCNKDLLCKVTSSRNLFWDEHIDFVIDRVFLEFGKRNFPL